MKERKKNILKLINMAKAIQMAKPNGWGFSSENNIKF